MAGRMNDAELFERLAAALRARRSVALLTVVATKGSVPRREGARMIVAADGATEGTIGGGRFESLAIEAAVAMLRERRRGGELREFALHEHSPDSFGAVCGGTSAVHIEPMGLGPRLLLVGAGHCARALARAAALLGWPSEVVEDRADAMEGAAFPAGTVLNVVGDVAAAMDTVALDPATAVCLLNRNHLLDRDCLGRLLRRLAAAEAGAGAGAAVVDAPFYLGMIGSARKVGRVFDELAEAGIDRAAFARVRTPIGIEIKADSPEEIAVSILAEIIATWRGASLPKSTA
jgi:xanthine dehydrogenase accessory factor